MKQLYCQMKNKLPSELSRGISFLDGLTGELSGTSPLSLKTKDINISINISINRENLWPVVSLQERDGGGFLECLIASGTPVHPTEKVLWPPTGIP